MVQGTGLVFIYHRNHRIHKNLQGLFKGTSGKYTRCLATKRREKARKSAKKCWGCFEFLIRKLSLMACGSGNRE